MPYTNAWSDNTPLGTLAANQIDESIRQLRLDIHERMNMIVVDWEADPVVPISSVGFSTYGVGYNDALSAGNKALDYQSIVATLALYFQGNAFGRIVTINLNEVNDLTGTTDWQAENIYNPIPDSDNIPVLAFSGRSGSAVLGLDFATVNIVANTINLNFDESITISVNPVKFFIMLGFLTSPIIAET